MVLGLQFFFRSTTAAAAASTSAALPPRQGARAINPSIAPVVAQPFLPRAAVITPPPLTPQALPAGAWPASHRSQLPAKSPTQAAAGLARHLHLTAPPHARQVSPCSRALQTLHMREV